MENKWLHRVLGESEMQPGTMPRKSNALSDESDPESAESDSTSVEDIPSEQVVNTLVQAWKQGSKDEVVTQLLFTPVSYADFIKMCFIIGKPEAVSLGEMLDDLAESEGLVSDIPGENKLLAQATERPDASQDIIQSK